MIGKIKKVVEYIDKNYHSNIDKDNIETLTNISYGHFRNRFKEITGISLDKYRIRRELTLIIEEINNNNSKLKESNILPWNSDNAFYTAFKKEFNITPKQYLTNENGAAILQKKLDIKEYIFNDKCIKELKDEYGTYENVLIHLLSLPVYKIDKLRLLVVYKDYKELYEDLIHDYYKTINGKEYCLVNQINKKYYKEHIDNLKKYYDINKGIRFDTFNDEPFSVDNVEECSFFRDSGISKIINNPIYIVVKRNLILDLFKLVDIELFFKSINWTDLKTIWHAMIEGERKLIQNGIGVMPNELVEQKILTFNQWNIVEEIVMMENGTEACEDIDDFRNRIEYDYDKPIEKEDICDNCKFKEYDYEIDDCKYAYDDNCPRYSTLTKEEKEYFDKPLEWETINDNTLKEELVNLMIMGIVYL